MKRLGLVLAFVLASACSKPSPAPAPAASAPSATPSASAAVSPPRPRFPPPHDVDVHGFPEVDGVPDPLACTTDSDCEVSRPPDPSACCTLSDGTPLAKAYRSAVEAWAKAHCGAYECPANHPPGALPAPCFLEARCRAKQCSNACAPHDAHPLRGTHALRDMTSP